LSGGPSDFSLCVQGRTKHNSTVVTDTEAQMFERTRMYENQGSYKDYAVDMHTWVRGLYRV